MRFLLILVMLFFICTAAKAAIFLKSETMPTVGLSGYGTFTVSLVSTNPNEIIHGVDAQFVGPMNHVNPLGMATPFNNLNGFFGAADVSQDSQFLFNSNNLSPPALRVVETDTLLAAAITNLPGATGGDGTIVPLAQIAINYRGNLDTRLSIDLRDREGRSIGNPTISGCVYCGPEPTGVSLLSIGLIGLFSVRQRRLSGSLIEPISL